MTDEQNKFGFLKDILGNDSHKRLLALISGLISIFLVSFVVICDVFLTIDLATGTVEMLIGLMGFSIIMAGLTIPEWFSPFGKIGKKNE